MSRRSGETLIEVIAAFTVITVVFAIAQSLMEPVYRASVKSSESYRKETQLVELHRRLRKDFQQALSWSMKDDKQLELILSQNVTLGYKIEANQLLRSQSVAEETTETMVFQQAQIQWTQIGNLAVLKITPEDDKKSANRNFVMTFGLPANLGGAQ